MAQTRTASEDLGRIGAAAVLHRHSGTYSTACFAAHYPIFYVFMNLNKSNYDDGCPENSSETKTLLKASLTEYLEVTSYDKLDQ